MKDFFNNDIKYGDYLIYPNRFRDKRIDMAIVKVDKLNKKTITVIAPSWQGKRNIFYVRHPERAIIISEEIALEKQPLFSKV